VNFLSLGVGYCSPLVLWSCNNYIFHSRSLGPALTSFSPSLSLYHSASLLPRSLSLFLSLSFLSLSVMVTLLPSSFYLPLSRFLFLFRFLSCFLPWLSYRQLILCFTTHASSSFGCCDSVDVSISSLYLSLSRSVIFFPSPSLLLFIYCRPRTQI